MRERAQDRFDRLVEKRWLARIDELEKDGRTLLLTQMMFLTGNAATLLLPAPILEQQQLRITELVREATPGEGHESDNSSGFHTSHMYFREFEKTDLMEQLDAGGEESVEGEAGNEVGQAIVLAMSGPKSEQKQGTVDLLAWKDSYRAISRKGVIECAVCESGKFKNGSGVTKHNASKRHLLNVRLRLYEKFPHLAYDINKITGRSEPHVDIQVIWKACCQDKSGPSWDTRSGEKNIKELQTTWAVEDFFRFGSFEAGYLSCKLTSSKELLIIVPPVEITHVNSKLTGQRCEIIYGWCQLNSSGAFRKAEGMPQPAEGWAHVEARARDAAAGMLFCKYPISEELVAKSEAILRAKYDSEEAFIRAREARQDARRNIVPEKEDQSQAAQDARVRREEKAMQTAIRYYEYQKNPYETYKFKPRPGE
ncbi:hypothetical protein KFL_011650010 [Klebsormidium nitens]|uniref:Uncharacterized protein n=1 Tax=Klebsormidium nitens TaxID=105231 RepID=A0A1Y1IVF7_KLENI|nr:hypothetical protein KFL_011650010 [Klebsormidium nitens]|eukprot:GAQ92846.1 hypothetical protein KFL_011650010 [Klebsormidium nitens]